MSVETLRWHDGTWRDKDGEPYDGIEPPEAEKKSGCWPVILACVLFWAVVIYLLRDHL